MRTGEEETASDVDRASIQWSPRSLVNDLKNVKDVLRIGGWPTVDILAPVSSVDGKMKLIDDMFLSIGAMKAGSSWLAKQLEEHPDIFITPLKEVHYFAHIHSSVRFLDKNARVEALKGYLAWTHNDIDERKLRLDLKWFDFYLDNHINDAWFYNIYRDRGDRRYCAEFSNITAILPPSAWSHIKALCKNIRVVYNLRNPMSRLWSHTRFQAAIEGMFDLLPSWGEAEYRSFLDNRDLVQHGCYSQTISNLHDQLGAEGFLLLYFDDFRRKPLNTLRKLEEFLSISSFDYGKDFDFQNPSPSLAMPAAFLLASRDRIATELDQLDKMNIRIPDDWILPATGTTVIDPPAAVAET